MNTEAKTIKELLSEFYHYKALYNSYREESNPQASRVELMLRTITIELRRREILL